MESNGHFMDAFCTSSPTSNTQLKAGRRNANPLMIVVAAPVVTAIV